MTSPPEEGGVVAPPARPSRVGAGRAGCRVIGVVYEPPNPLAFAPWQCDEAIELATSWSPADYSTVFAVADKATAEGVCRAAMHATPCLGTPPLAHYLVAVHRWEQGTRFGWHADRHTNIGSHQLFAISVTVQLSDPDAYRGGDLYLAIQGNDVVAGPHIRGLSARVPRTRGTVVAFRSETRHTVTTVESGVRYSAVGFLSWAVPTEVVRPPARWAPP